MADVGDHAASLRGIASSIEPVFPSAASTLRAIAGERGDGSTPDCCGQPMRLCRVGHTDALGARWHCRSGCMRFVLVEDPRA